MHPLVIFLVCSLKSSFGKIFIHQDCSITFENPVENDIGDSFIGVKKISSGAHGNVLLLVSKKWNTCKYALKQYCYDDKTLEEDKVRADDEAKILSELADSPYFPKFYGQFSITKNNTTYNHLFLEYLQKDLFDFRRRNDFKINWIPFIAAELATAIEYLHSKRIIHGDIKLENLMLTPEGHLKIIDFSMSIKTPSLAVFYKKRIGTKATMAPELVYEKEFNYQIDWYAYGVTLHNLHFIDQVEDEFWSFRNRYVRNNNCPLSFLISHCTEEHLDERISSLTQVVNHYYFDSTPKERCRFLCLPKKNNIFKFDWEMIKTGDATPPESMTELTRKIATKFEIELSKKLERKNVLSAKKK